jgi:hypothetical protein
MKRDRSSTIPRSGRFLADLAVNDRFANSRGDYWAVRGAHLLQVDPSVLARDDAAGAALWEDSARLVGMPCD